MTRAGAVIGVCLALVAGWVPPARAQSRPVEARAQVVLVFDNSTSMRQPGLDPQRASLLVAKLFVDIVPGELAIVRMLDLGEDEPLFVKSVTAESEPCVEDPTKKCAVVKIDEAAALQRIRDQRAGALVRPRRADVQFKRSLDGHLEQRINNTYASLGFVTARAILDPTEPADPLVPRFVLWLTDGKPQPFTQEGDVGLEIGMLQAAGATVFCILFDQGEDRIARDSGLSPIRVSNPLSMVQAFADTLYAILETQHKLGALVAARPTFDVEPRIDEAWVIVWGDDTLESAAIVAPDGREIPADHGADRQVGAGAYRVAYMVDPSAGRWTVRHAGGGSAVAYAVIQRDATVFRPRLPQLPMAGAEPVVEVDVTDPSGEPVIDALGREEIDIEAVNEAGSFPLNDDGERGDKASGDGTFSGDVPFPRPGKQDLLIRMRRERNGKPVRDSTARLPVDVEETFRYEGLPTRVDFGRLRTGESRCRTVTPALAQRHSGRLAFRLMRPPWFPEGYGLDVHAGGRATTFDGEPVFLRPGEPFDVCLGAEPHAVRSRIEGQDLALAVDGTAGLPHGLPMAVTWDVRPPSFLDRWGKSIAIVGGVLLGLVTIAGFVMPRRFSPRLAIALAAERQDLDEQTPQPLRTWPGVGIGFFRNARAFLRADFRWSGRPAGAIAGLRATKAGAYVLPLGPPLFLEALDGDWQAVPTDGRRALPGDTYRIGDRGPYFRTSTRAQ